jgi:hypothetical protein
MDTFTVSLGRSSYIIKDGIEVKTRAGVAQEGYGVLPRDDARYDGIDISGVSHSGELDYIFIGEHYKTEALIESVKDDPLFEREAHFIVKGRYHKGKNAIEFDGTLFDALLVIANEGAQYDV